jgi:arylsulfatase A-like enzyme
MQLRRGRAAALLSGAMLALGAAISALVVADRGTEVSTVPASPTAVHDSGAPNVVVVMTDDQALATMRGMPLTRRLIGDAGTTFHDAFVSFPLCCPSRATFLTGQYAHNNRVRDNHPPAGGYQALDTQHTLPVSLARAGYATGFVGKFLNGYGEGSAIREVPAGWNEWYALPGRNKQRAFDFDLNENGELVHYSPGKGRSNYKTKVLADKAAGFVRRRAPASARSSSGWPPTGHTRTRTCPRTPSETPSRRRAIAAASRATAWRGTRPRTSGTSPTSRARCASSRCSAPRPTGGWTATS